MKAKSDHAKQAHQYALDVVKGNILVAEWVKLACERHFKDLRHSKNADFKYYYNEDTGARVCRFIECWKIFEGPKAGENIKLMPWQCFIVCSIFGWLCKDGERKDKRRYRRAYIELPRGNGKSALASALSLYMTLADGEGGAQTLAASTSKDVAKIVFFAAQQMAKSNPEFLKHLGAEIRAHVIFQQKSASRFMAISADSKTSDGKNVHMVTIDELHLHKDRRLYDSLETGMGKRNNSLMLSITTAGVDTSGVCFEVRNYLTKILHGLIEDETTFGIIYTIPEGGDWRDPQMWAAANPGLGVMVMPEIIEQLCKKAQQTPAAQSNFRTKHLSEWQSAGAAWLDMAKLKACIDNNMKISDFRNDELFIGLDLASRVDIAAKLYLFVRDRHYYAFTQCYLNEAAVISGKNSQYRGWEIEGLLTITAGDVTDFDVIERDLKKDARDYNLVEIAYDPYQATDLAQRLQKERIPVIEVGQNVKNLSPAMKFIEALIYDRRLHYNCPILTWMFSNVVVKEDKNQNIFPYKLRPEDKIDLCSALFSAICRAMLKEDTTSIYESQELFTLGRVDNNNNNKEDDIVDESTKYDEFEVVDKKKQNFDPEWLKHGWR